jgi:hypothetical protein
MDGRETQASGKFRATPMNQAAVAAHGLMMQLYAILQPIFQSTGGPVAWQGLSERFCQSMRTQFQIAGVAEFDLQIAGTRMTLNRRRIRLEGMDHARALTVGQWLSSVGVVRLQLSSVLEASHVQPLAQLVGRMRRGERHDAERIEVGAFTLGVAPWDPRFEELVVELRGCARLPILHVYADCLSQIVELDPSAADNELEDLEILLKPIALQLVDALRADPAGVLGLLSMRAVPGHPEVIRFDTALLTTALALALGLNDIMAMEFATAALLSPIYHQGSSWLVAPSGVTVASRMCKSSHSLARVVTYESLLGQGRIVPSGGYGSDQEKHVASLIVDVARGYVDLVHGRPGFPSHLPSAAMLRMIAHSGSRFDDDVIGALVCTMGLYPPGSIVQLNSGDLAVVIDTPPVGGDQRRPTVRLLTGDPSHSYPLHEAALSEYAIVGPADRPAAGLNPMFLLLV